VSETHTTDDLVAQPRQNAARLISFGLLSCTAALLIVSAVAGWQVARLPFPGFFTEPTLIVSGSSDPAWVEPGVRLAFPDRVVALGQHGLGSPTALYDALRHYRTGSVVVATVQDPYAGSERAVQLSLTPVPAQALLNFFVLPHLLGLFFLAIGFWVLWTQRRGELGPIFAAVCSGGALVVGLLFDGHTTHYLWWMWLAAIPLSGSGLLHLALAFPRRARLVRRAFWLVWLGYLVGVVLAVVSLVVTADWQHPASYFDSWFWGRAWTGLTMLLLVGALLYHRVFPASPIVRAQAGTVLLGTALAFGPTVLWSLASRRLGLPFPPLLVLPWLALFPLSVAYAIPHHRTLDVGWVLRQSIVYALVTLILVAVYLALPQMLSRVLGVDISIRYPAVLGSFALLVAVGLGPVKRGLRWLVDRILAGRRITHRQALERLRRHTAAAGMLQDVCTALGEVLESTIGLQHAALYLLDSRTGQYVPHPVLGESLLAAFASDGPLACRMVEGAHPLYVEPDEPLAADLRPEQEMLAELAPALLVPVRAQGWLAARLPPLGRRFRTDDLRFMEAVAAQIAAALGHVHLVSSLEWRQTEMEAIVRIAQALGYSVDLDSVLELVYTQIGRVLDSTNLYIALHNPDQCTLRFAFYVENGERLYLDYEWPDSEGLTGVILRTGQSIVTDDYLAECKRRGVKPGGKPGKAWMGMPLVSQDRVLGVMNVSSFDAQHSYTPDQARVFRAVADQVAAMLDKARLYETMQRRARQLEVLNEVGSVIGSSLELNVVLDLIMDKAVELLQAEAGSLLLLDQVAGDLVFHVTAGPRSANLVGARLPLGTGIVGRVAQRGVPILVEDVRQDERWHDVQDRQSGFVTRSVICVPMSARGRVVGVIELLNRSDGNPFGAEDRHMLTAFAAQAATCIENARLFTLTDQALAARVEELSTMQRVDRELNATLDYRRVMEVALDWALHATHADIGVVAVVVGAEDEQQGLRFLANRGYPQQVVGDRAEELWPQDQGIIGRAVQSGESILVEDVQSDPEYVAVVPRMAAQLCVPIRREDRVIGVIALESSQAGRMTQDGLEFVVRLADHAAIAIENSRLFEAVQAANDAKTEFVSFVSHELQQPMTAIKGYTDLLAKGVGGEINETQRSFLEVVQVNVERLSALVRDLLDVSRIEAGRLRLELGPVAIRDVVAEAVRGAEEQVKKREQHLEIDLPDTLPPVHADRGRLVQILANLLSNAYKYTPEGGSIRVSAALSDGPDGAEAGFVCCSVADTGIGVSEEDQRQLFSKYFRADHPQVRSVPGTGLGLVITKSLVELQGGQIWVHSQPGEGSTFAFTVPVTEH
jgi:signal transduction histidine kinase